MKFAVACALFGAVNTMGGPPDEAYGECEESSECPEVCDAASGACEPGFCVFSFTEVDAEKTWNPSVCGVEADCNEALNAANREDPDFDEDNKEVQFCKEHRDTTNRPFWK